MLNLENSVCVVTGAGSGIGQALALGLAKRGANLALSDVNQSALANTQRLLADSGVRVHAQVLDVSNRDAVFSYAKTVDEHFGQVNLLVNNAGVALSSGLFRDTTIDEFEWLMSINFSGVLYGTKAFLPFLEKSEWGQIVNLSSLFGLIGVAEQSAYNSSKFAVRGFTESLANEFEETDSSVRATSIHPGGIKTNIARNARLGELLDKEQRQEVESRKANFDKVAKTTAESAAEQIIDGAVRRKRRVVVGTDAKLLDKIQRLLPTRYNAIFVWLKNKLSGDEEALSVSRSTH